MKIIIHPKYRYLYSYIQRVVSGYYTTEESFCNSRNVVEKITIDGKEFVLKRYKRPTILNCIVYTFFRKSKARRAYENALRLLENGINTPFPVAYIEKRRYGLFHTGYLITEYMNLSTLAQLKTVSLSADERYKLDNDLIEFVVLLQDKGIQPLDFNPANILYRYNECSASFSFALVDINRMRFGKVHLYKDAMRAFEQFQIATDKFYYFLSLYSANRNLDKDRCVYEFLKIRLRNRYKHFIKGKLKRCLNIQVKLVVR